MNTVTRIPNTFTDRFIADCGRCSFGTTAEDYSDERVAKFVARLTRMRHVNPMFHPMITVRVSRALPLDVMAKSKTLMAGLNLHQNYDESWSVTTSAWGLMELSKAFDSFTHIDSIAAFSRAFNKHWNNNDNEWKPVECKTPRHHQWFTFSFDSELVSKDQLYTHTVGIVKSSKSLRYAEPDRFYKPEFRGVAEDVKQGSSDVIVEEKPVYLKTPSGGIIELRYDDLNRLDKQWYDNNAHIAKECRRFKLPVSTMTRYVVTGTREAWERVIGLRIDPHAQKEIRLLIEQVADEIASDTVWG